MYGRFTRAKLEVCNIRASRLLLAGGLLTLTACGGGGGGLEVTESKEIPQAAAQSVGVSLIANDDLLEVVGDQPVSIPLLANDTFAQSGGNELQLLGHPVNGTVRILDNGQIEYTWNGSDEGGSDEINYRIVDEAGNSKRSAVYLAVACSSCDTTVAPSSEPALGAAQADLTAVADSVTVFDGQVAAVVPLRNDAVSDPSAVRLSVYTPPAEGAVVAQGNGLIVYRAPSGFEGSDSMSYSVSDGAGNESVANIDFTVECPTCAYSALQLTWPANDVGQQISGYRIYFGSDENEFTSSLVREIWLTNTRFDADAPKVNFNLKRDLKITGREGGCFSITAFKGDQESERSETTCFTLG